MFFCSPVLMDRILHLVVRMVLTCQLWRNRCYHITTPINALFEIIIHLHQVHLYNDLNDLYEITVNSLRYQLRQDRCLNSPKTVSGNSFSAKLRNSARFGDGKRWQNNTCVSCQQEHGHERRNTWTFFDTSVWTNERFQFDILMLLLVFCNVPKDCAKRTLLSHVGINHGSITSLTPQDQV